MTRTVLLMAALLPSIGVGAGAPTYRDCYPTMLMSSMSVHAGRGDGAMVDWFLKAGVPPNGFSIDQKGCALGVEFSLPLHAASASGHLNVVRLLLNAGADPNKVEGAGRDGAGDTALLSAIEFGDARVVELLLTYGANPDIPRRGSAIDLARKLNKPELVNLLEKQQAAPNQPLHPTPSAAKPPRRG